MPPLEEPNQMVTKTRAEKKQNKKGGHAKKSGHSLLLTDLIIREKIKEAAKKEWKWDDSTDQPSKWLTIAHDLDTESHFWPKFLTAFFLYPFFFFFPHCIQLRLSSC